MISETAKNALNNPELLEVFNFHQHRLGDVFSGKPTDSIFILSGISCYSDDARLDWETWLDESLTHLAECSKDACNRETFRPLVITFNPHGVHFVDSVFGADVFLLGDSWQVNPLTSPVGTLQYPDLEAAPAWQNVRDFARAFIECDVADVTLGLPTIASALNIAVNLYGQEILLAMAIDPTAAHHDLQIINQVLCEMHQWFLDNIPPERYQCIIPSGRFQLPGYGQICGCTTQLVSAATYDEFIAPLDDAVLSVYPHGGMIHLCGTHTQHLDTWKSLPSFRAFQMNDRASEDLQLYLDGLRNDQIMYVQVCPTMPFDKIVEITKGKQVVIVYRADEFLDTTRR